MTTPVSLQTDMLHGQKQHGPFNAHTFPIFASSTFRFDDVQQGADAFVGKSDALIYTRLANPTVMLYESLCAKAEGVAHGLAFGSGMAAINASVMPFVSAGDHVLAGECLYGCSVTFLRRIAQYGIEVEFIDMHDVAEVEAKVRPNTKLLYLETPANPTLAVYPLAPIADICKRHNIVSVCDNTFTTGAFQRPCSHGFDMTLLSVTKYLNGHGDVVGGVVTTDKEELHAAMAAWRGDTGGLMSPFDAYLCARGIRTLGIRMRQHHENGLAVASFLESHPKIERVFHPGLPSHPDYEVAKQQMQGHGSTFSFELKGGVDAATKLLNSVKVATLAVSLGCVDTLIQAPACMTHSHVPPEQRVQAGITDGLTRISVGIEDVQDIIADLSQALDQI